MGDGRGWAVGERGTILYTSDRGMTWQSQESPTRLDLYCLHFVDPDRGWIGGVELTLFRRLPQ